MTDGQTDRRTDGQTDGWTKNNMTPSYRYWGIKKTTSVAFPKITIIKPILHSEIKYEKLCSYALYTDVNSRDF